MAEKNSTILKTAWLNGTNDYQQRVPAPTQSNITATMDALFDPMNKQYLNQFMDALVNRIAFTYVKSKKWDNVLAPFKGEKVNYGATIQEIAPKWIKAHSYNDADQTLLKLHRPEAQAWYHSQNRKDQYAITINYEELRTAFTEEYGLNNLISEIMTVPMSSDNYDEYRIMLQLLAEYENRWGFYKQNLSAIPTDETTGKEFLTSIKTYAGRLQFPSCLYNASAIEDIPVFAKPSELILFTTPETSASVDVNTLASVFHLDKADPTNVTKIIVDEFPIPNAVALLTTRDFFVCNDTVYQTTSFYNPQRMDTTYYLQHWGIYSVSPFVPAILFTTDTGTETQTITEVFNGFTTSNSLIANPAVEYYSDDAVSYTQIPKYGLTINTTGTVDSETTVYLKPQSATFTIENSKDAKTRVVSKRETITTRNGTKPYEYILYIGEDDYNNAITIKAKCTYQNPSGETTFTKETSELTLTYKPPTTVALNEENEEKEVAE